MKLKEETFVQWQNQIKFIVDGYDLTGYIHGTLHTMSRFVPDRERKLASNPDFVAYHQQYNLLAS